MNYIHIMTVNVSQNILNIARSHDPNPWTPFTVDHVGAPYCW